MSPLKSIWITVYIFNWGLFKESQFFLFNFHNTKNYVPFLANEQNIGE